MIGTLGFYDAKVKENNGFLKKSEDLGEKHSFYVGNESETEQEYEISEENYYEVEDKILEEALTDYTNDSGEDITIESLEELYGNKIEDELIEEVAKIQIASSMGIDIKDFSNIEEVKLDNKMLLFDANERNAYVGFNYFVNNDEYGYIIISTHTRAPLVREDKKNILLPKEAKKVYYLSEGEFYIESNNSYKTLQNIQISLEDFEELKNSRVEGYYNYTKDLLASLELDTLNMLNNAIFLTTEIESQEELLCGKTYKGQDGSGYGGIYTPETYLKERYGGSISLSSSKTLFMNSFICLNFNEKNNCVLVAITRILQYYSEKGYTKIPANYYDIYRKVLEVAKSYGFTEKKGTYTTKINNIIDKVLDDYGYGKSYSKGIYVWSFKDQVKSEIDKDRPVVMNIARGYYGNHSVTVCGYSVYKSKHKFLFTSYKKTHNMICVYDGWSYTKRYIDYEAFAYDLISSGFGSFNTVIMKK